MEIKYNLETEPYYCEFSLLSDALNTLEYINKNKSGHYASIAILGHDFIIEKLLKAICRIDFAKSDAELSLDSLDYSYTEYDNEYALIISLEDCYTREFTVSIEKATYEDGTYKTYDMDYLYIDENCENELVKKHLQYEDTMDVFCITDECDEEELDNNNEFECDLNEDEFAEDEFIELYDLVESMVESILENKFTRR